MCMGCWEEHYDAAQIDTPAVRDAAAKIARVYEFSEVGGGLHVAVDDFNLEDACCNRFTDFDNEYSAEQIAAEEDCSRALLALTIPERASALALHDGFWK